MAIRPLSAFSEAGLANLVEPRLGDSIESAATAISFGNSIAPKNQRAPSSVKLSPGLEAQRRLIELYDMLDGKPVKDTQKIALNTLQTGGTSSSSSRKRNLTPSPGSEKESDDDLEVDSELEDDVPNFNAESPAPSLNSDNSLLFTSNFDPSVSALDFSSPDDPGSTLKRKKSDNGESPRLDLLAEEPRPSEDTGTTTFNPDNLFA